jgi:hypothetical protein
MSRNALVTVAVFISLWGVSRAQQNSAGALEQALHEVCADMELWPGYDPLAVPLAVFDGSRTFLFRHPAPPDEFTRDGDMWVCEGRHPSITANSSAAIGGVTTGTVMLETLAPDDALEVKAALVAHEGFHVFQGTTGRRWGANEVDLFTYPVDDARLLSLRRLETEALRRAFEAGEEDETRAWALSALRFRDERFALLDPASRAYEQGIETMEGTADYVQSLVEGRDRPALPEDGFDAENVRTRAYTTGSAWAFLLDRFSPAWHASFASDEALTLDAVLADALAEAEHADGPAAFTDSEIWAVEETAHADVGAVLERRSERRAEFESVPGWRVVIEAEDGSPLWPQGFDPLNVHLVEGGVLHSRFIRLGNESGNLEVMGAAALTEEIGPHPLFNGVRRLLVAGLESEPSVAVDGDRVIVSSEVLTADFARAGFERGVREIVVRLGPAEESGSGSSASTNELRTLRE